MGFLSSFNSHAQFHARYLKLILEEKGLVYSKNNPKEVCKNHYLKEIVSRINKYPEHLKSFQKLYDFFKLINSNNHEMKK